jgi:uncharacterized protein YceK
MRSGNLALVKSLRIWILVLLAVLLPIRGAVAAVMGCASVMTMHSSAPPMTSHDHQGMQMQEQTQTQTAADSGDCCDGDHDGDGRGGDAGASTGCGICCDLCSLTPMLGVELPVEAPQRVVAAVWVERSASSFTFQVDGPERPPRSI